jgi:hypothetical protein
MTEYVVVIELDGDAWGAYVPCAEANRDWHHESPSRLTRGGGPQAA